MSQDELIILMLKIFCITGFLSLAGWVAQYSRYAAAWRNPIGRSLMAKTLLIAALLVPTTLSLFFSLNRFTSLVVGWVDVVLIGLITPVMWWRIGVWYRIHSKGGGFPSEREAALKAENAALKTENAALRERLGGT